MSDRPEIVLPGGRGPSGNPLVMLQAETAKQTEVIRLGMEAIAKAVGAGVRHVYALEPVEDEHTRGFMSYCLGCSEAQRQYVYPCRVHTLEELPAPPSQFSADPF